MTATPETPGAEIVATTGASGSFTLTVGPGCYRVSASSPSLGTLVYPDTVSTDRSTLVNIVNGESRSGVDFHFGTTYSISGTLSLSSGSFPASLHVVPTDRSGTVSHYGKVVRAPDWSFPHMKAGTYLVVATSPASPRAFRPAITAVLRPERRDAAHAQR